MSKYDIKYNKLVQMLLPVCLRGPVIVALLRCMVAPIGVLHAALISYRKQQAYRLNHNGQVFSLTNVLNDRFDPIQRGITISDSDNNEVGFRLYVRSMERHTLVPKRDSNKRLPLFRRGFGGSTGFGFWVNVPSRLASDAKESEIRAVVNEYKLASIRFGISFNSN